VSSGGNYGTTLIVDLPTILGDLVPPVEIWEKKL
jgi:hypothetical protein